MQNNEVKFYVEAKTIVNKTVREMGCLKKLAGDDDNYEACPTINKKSYVQRAYARTRSEEAYESKPKFLREKGEISVLLAYFADEVSQKQVSLAQVLWMDKGSVKKFFAIAGLELTTENLAEYREISRLKKALKVNEVEVFDNFSKYAQQFRKRVGLASNKALDLFNQTVSIKQIDGLNTFVRNHMLEAADMREKIDGLVGSYENLTISHNSIPTARKQLEILTPPAKESNKPKKAEATLYTRLSPEQTRLEQERISQSYVSRCLQKLLSLR